MSTVIMHAVMSVDGFIAHADDGVGPLFDWYQNGDVEFLEGATFRVTRVSADYVKPMWASVGTLVIGRHLFDMTDGWQGSPPAGDHVVVVSHRAKPEGWEPHGTTEGPHPGPAAHYHFVDDVARAVTQAKQLAGPRNVYVTAGEVGGQALALGLVDEVAMDVAPVVFGSGKRYFGSVDTEHLLDDPHTVIQGERVLHLRYRVRSAR